MTLADIEADMKEDILEVIDREEAVSMMEPLMMMILGGIVGTILVAMYLPIFTIAGAVGG